MNTLKLIKTAMVIGIAVTLASCAKDSNDPDTKSPYSDAGQNEDKKIGQILDYGTNTSGVKGELRLMQASFENAGEITYAGTGEISGKGTNVNLSFYTDMDDMIPSGSYSFASGEVKEAYTLAGGFVTYVIEGDQDGYLNSKVTDGDVEVSYVGGLYTFSFNLMLENGDYLTGSVNGEMDYYDIHL